jgi:hypothetical protein
MRSYAAWIVLTLAVAHASAASADCKADAAAFEDYMRGLDRGFELAVVPRGTTLAPRERLVTTPHALHVDLTPKGISVGFEAVELAKLGAELALRARMQADPEWQKSTPGWAGHYRDVVLVIDEAVPWSEVATVAGLAARAGFSHAYFMFARAQQAVPPPHTSIDDAVAKATTEGDRLIALVPARRRFEASCFALTKALAVIPRDTATWFRDTFVPGFGAALTACDCKVDLAELRSWMFYELTPIVQTGSLEVQLVKTGRRLALPGKMPWREASKKLAAGTGWLVAR